MSLAQLQREVNAIKRHLVHELRVVRARRVVTRYCDLWADLVARKILPPSPARLAKNLIKHTGGNGHFLRARDYLNDCREQRHLPHPNAILSHLLPSETSMGLIPRRKPEPVPY